MSTKIILALVFTLCLQWEIKAQSSPDSVDLQLPKVRATEISDPMKAALLSAVLPGAGQVYNKKYWKLPLVYGGAVGFGLAIQYNHERFVLFRNALVIETDDDPNTVNEGVFQNFDAAALQRIRDRYRRDRDFSIILALGFYGLNIVDAVVDAHLKEFDVSEDLSMKVSPKLIPVPGQNHQSAVVFGLSFQAQF